MAEPVEAPAARATAPRRGSPRGLAIAAVSAVVGFAGRVWVRAGAAPLVWNDSADYLRSAAAPVFSLDRIAGPRPVLTPTVLWVTGSDLGRFVRVQEVVASLAWALLAASVAVSFTGRGRRIAPAGLIIAFSLTWPIAMWDQQVLTESLAISAFALLVTSGIWFARRLDPVSGAVLVVTAAIWMLARDSHIVPVALVGIGLAVAGWRGWAKPARVVIMVGAYLIASAFLVAATAEMGQRGDVPLEHVYQSRVLPDHDRVVWFAEHGMPQAPALEALPEFTSEPGLAPYTPVPKDSAWSEWRDWVASDGRAALAEFAVTHPGYVWSEPLKDPPRVFNDTGGLDGYRPLALRDVPLLATVLHPPLVVVLAAGALALTAMGARRLRWTPVSTIGAVTAVLALPHALLVWHSDGMEASRHLLVPSIQLQTGVLLLVIAAAAGTPAPRRPRPTGTDRSRPARSLGRRRAPLRSRGR